MDFANYWFSAAGDQPSPLGGNSLRFQGSDAQNLTRYNPVLRPSASSTASIWFKISKKFTGTTRLALFSTTRKGVSSSYQIAWQYTDDTVLFQNPKSSGSNSRRSVSLLRDCSAWYNLVFQCDTNNAWVNGIKLTMTDSKQLWSSIASADTFYIGRWVVGTDSWQGLVSSAIFVDGQQLDPTAFGKYNENGIWVPIEYTGEYGPTGFNLDFSDPTNIGKDVSGNGNDFTATGFELDDTTSPDYAWMADSPSDNFATMNSALPATVISKITYSDANLTGQGANTQNPIANTRGTMLLTGGKWYHEATWSGSGKKIYIGACTLDQINTDQSTTEGFKSFGCFYWGSQGVSRLDAVGTDPTWAAWEGAGDVGAIAIDMDAQTITGYKNNVEVGTVDISAWGNSPLVIFDAATNNTFGYFNYGQRPFAYEPPAGFKSIQTSNLPTPAITNGTSANSQVFVDAGTGDPLTQIQAKFPQGLWWVKGMDPNAGNTAQAAYQFMSSLTGNTSYRCGGGSKAAQDYVNPSDPAGTNFDSFAIGFGLPDTYTGSGVNQGLINAAAGMSICTYTGNGADPQSIAHGLGDIPDWVCVWDLTVDDDSDRQYSVYGPDLGIDVGKYIRMNTSGGQTNTSNMYDSLTATDVLVQGKYGNSDGVDYMMWCWKSIPGYSLMGHYTGNADADGNFIYCGFTPELVIIEKVKGANWMVYTAENMTQNPCPTANGARIYPFDQIGGKQTGSDTDVDLLSNGFKLRESSQTLNSDNTYMFQAFAKNPFGGPNLTPVTAR